MAATGDPLAEFAAVLAARGLSAKKIIADGRIHRCDAGADRAGKGDGAYILHLDGVPAGGCMSWRDGLGWENWVAKLDRPMSPAEKKINRARMDEARKAKAAEEKASHADAAERAAKIWQEARPAPDDHPYLTRKGVKAHGLRVSRGALVVPVYGEDGLLQSLQFIGQDGSKLFLAGGKIDGGMFTLGRPNGRLCVAEGFATAASIHEATGHAVAIVFTAGNIKPAAKIARRAMPGVDLVFCADDDHRTDGNPGVSKSTDAAVEFDGFIVRPEFGEDRGEKWTDFNDLAVARGAEEVAAQIARALRARKPPPVAEDPPEPPPPQTDPTSALERRLSMGLDLTEKGQGVVNMNNARLILENDPKLRGHAWYDLFLQRIMTGDPPREWHDVDDTHLTVYIQRELRILKMSVDAVSRAVIAHAMAHPRHCVREWLKTLQWDGEERCKFFFHDYFGAEDNVYTRAVANNFWLSICARLHRPGCQMDNMIVLEGAQGAGKSQALRVIGGPWFAEQHESVTGRGFYEVIQGKLLVEISEMDSFTKGEISRVKAAISCASDRFREPYAKHASDHPRQCALAGTTNTFDWNRDETGARRFWPLRCVGTVDVDGIASARPQLFAEAWARIQAGESWWIMPQAETETEQRKRYASDIWQEKVQVFLEARQSVSLDEICEDCLVIKVAERDQRTRLRLGSIMRFLGWENRTARVGGRVVKRWFAAGPNPGLDLV